MNIAQHVKFWTAFIEADPRGTYDREMDAYRPYTHAEALEQARDHVAESREWVERNGVSADEQTAALALGVAGVVALDFAWDEPWPGDRFLRDGWLPRWLRLCGQSVDVTPAVTVRRCGECGEPLTSPRPEARYCSTRCRVAAHRAKG